KGTLDDKLKNLKKWGNINLPSKIGITNITGIKAIADPKKGTISLEVTTDTPGATPSTKILKGSLIGKSDDQIAKEIATKKANDNNNSFNTLIQNKKIVNQGTNSVSTIADELNKGTLGDKLKSFKKWGNINLPSKIGITNITGIKAIADPKKGTISLEVTTNTPGATPSTRILKGSLIGKADLKLEKSGDKKTPKTKNLKNNNNKVAGTTNPKSRNIAILLIVTIIAGLTAIGAGIANFIKK
ncbi:hypothetical protein, partial [Mycoplasma todarodis]